MNKSNYKLNPTIINNTKNYNEVNSFVIHYKQVNKTLYWCERSRWKFKLGLSIDYLNVEPSASRNTRVLTTRDVLDRYMWHGMGIRKIIVNIIIDASTKLLFHINCILQLWTKKRISQLKPQNPNLVLEHNLVFPKSVQSGL